MAITITGDIITQGPWVDVRSFASLAAAVASPVTAGKQIWVTNAQTVSANLTIPADRGIKVQQGGMITVDSGFTLTINGPFEAGLYQVFSGSGEVTGLKESIPQWFGAAGDGSTDDTAAINRAASVVGLKKLTFLVSAGRYVCSRTVSIPANVDVEMQQGLTFTAAAATNEPGLVIGAQGVVNYASLQGLDVTRTTVADWSNEANIGIKLFNSNSAKISIKSASRFAIGAQFIGSGGGFSYNEVVLGDMGSNAVGVDCTSETYSAVIGWCNENNYYGGRFWCLSAITTLGRVGIRIKSKDGTYLNHNNNNFYKPSFELGLNKDSIGFNVVDGTVNWVHQARSEGNDLTAKFENASSSNAVILGYNSASTQSRLNTSTRGNNFVYLPDDNIYSMFANNLFMANNLPLITNVSNGSGYIYTQGMSWNVNGALSDITPVGTKANDYITVNSQPLGIMVDTSTAKRFMLDRKGLSGGRVAVLCLDDTGTILTSAGSGHPYARGSSPAPLTYTASYGGVYRTGSDALDSQFIEVGADVKKAFISIAEGTAAAQISSFKLFTDSKEAVHVSTGLAPRPVGQLASAIPTVGTYTIGERIGHSAPAVGQPKGWSCTVSGTFGTLAGVTGGITTGTKILTVNDATNVKFGHYITIAGVAGVKRVTKVSGTTVYVDTNASATVAGAAVAYQTPTMVSEGNL